MSNIVNSNSNYRYRAYFKLAYTEKKFTQDIYSDYTCTELHEKIMANMNTYIMTEDNRTITNTSQFEIIPIRNSENGLALRKTDEKLYDILEEEDLKAFYIRHV